MLALPLRVMAEVLNPGSQESSTKSINLPYISPVLSLLLTSDAESIRSRRMGPMFPAT